MQNGCTIFSATPFLVLARLGLCFGGGLGGTNGGGGKASLPSIALVIAATRPEWQPGLPKHLQKVSSYLHLVTSCIQIDPFLSDYSQV